MTQRQDPTTLDPHNHRETPTDNVLLHAYEGILWRGPEGEIIESLATEWEAIEDDRHRFTIRDDVQFHDGTSLEPSDCVFTIRRIVNPDVGGLESPQRDQLAGVVDAEVVDGERAIDVLSGGPNPMTFPNIASFANVVSEDWISERDGEEIAADINGTGPYRLADYTPEEVVRFEKFDDYWGEKPDVDQVEIIAAGEDSTRVGQLQAGETDIVSAVPPTDAGRVESEDSLRIEDIGSTRILMCPMVYNEAPFDSVEFRQAMNYAIDLEQMIDEILRGFGVPTGQPTLPGYNGHSPDVEPYPYDPDQAEQLVEESGYAGAEIELEYPAGRYLLNDELAQAAAGFIDELGNASCKAVSRDFGTLAGELLDGDLSTTPSFYNIGWGNTTFDASQTLTPFLTEGGIYNYTSPEMEELKSQWQVETDPDAREQILQDANQLAHDDAVWVFLNREWLVYGINERIDWNPRQDEYFLAQGMSRS
ncbi:peptide ABC transporter substrate-binding protein [Halobacteriales archaeon QH_10_65_19]|nr:MAG: peptide ABC transporter substrate-binding protein [Halobacteriales archaeon QH_10_65_19]